MNTLEIDRLLVRLGGSHRKAQRQHAALKANGVSPQWAGAATLGSKFGHYIVPDTEAVRSLIKSIGGSIAKRQWNHLKASYWQDN